MRKLIAILLLLMVDAVVTERNITDKFTAEVQNNGLIGLPEKPNILTDDDVELGLLHRLIRNNFQNLLTVFRKDDNAPVATGLLTAAAGGAHAGLLGLGAPGVSEQCMEDYNLTVSNFDISSLENSATWALASKTNCLLTVPYKSLSECDQYFISNLHG